MQGEGLRDEVREEDDSAILTINGEPIRVEQAEFEVTTAEDGSVSGTLRRAIALASGNSRVFEIDDDDNENLIGLPLNSFQIRHRLVGLRQYDRVYQK